MKNKKQIKQKIADKKYKRKLSQVRKKNKHQREEGIARHKHNEMMKKVKTVKKKEKGLI